MALLLAAKVWHYWISIALTVPIVLVVIAIVVGYIIKVVGPKYTRR
jgi:hypothetical protein